MKLLKFFSLIMAMLAIAGCSTGLNGIEVYSGKLEKPSQMIIPFSNAQAFQLKDGRILVYGKEFRSENSNYKYIPGQAFPWQIFDPGSKSYILTGSPRIEKGDEAVVKLDDGRILLTGGGWDPIVRTEIYNPITGQFTDGPHMLRPRSQHSATLLNDGTVLIVGGWYKLPQGGRAVIKEAEIYDPKQNKFYFTGSMTDQLGEIPAAFWGYSSLPSLLLPSGQVLIAGRRTYEIYDPKKKKFTIEGKLEIIGSSRAMVLLKDGRIFFPGSETQQVAVYSPDKNRFEIIGKLKSLYGARSAIVLENGKVLMTGRTSQLPYHRFGMEIYDPRTGVFEPITDFKSAFMGLELIQMPNEKVLLLGGYPEHPIDTLIYEE